MFKGKRGIHFYNALILIALGMVNLIEAIACDALQAELDTILLT